MAWPSAFLKRYSSTGVFLRILKFFNTSGCLLHVPLNFEKLFRTPFFIENLWEISYFKCKLQYFSQHILVSRVLFKHFAQQREITIESCSFNQDPWKLYMKKSIRSNVARSQPASLWEKFFHTYSFMYFVFLFSEHIKINYLYFGCTITIHLS